MIVQRLGLRSLIWRRIIGGYEVAVTIRRVCGIYWIQFHLYSLFEYVAQTVSGRGIRQLDRVADGKIPGIKLRVLMFWDYCRHRTSCAGVLLVPFVMFPGIKLRVLMCWGYGRLHTACDEVLVRPDHI